MLSLKQSIHPRMKLAQRPYLKAKLIQALRISQLPVLEFLKEVDQMALDNPVFEVIQEGSWHGSGDGSESYTRQDQSPEDVFHSLKIQLELMKLDDQGHQIGLALIDALDAYGFLRNYPEIQAQICQQMGVLPYQVEDVLLLLHTFDPEGIASRSLQECLLIQVNQYDFKNEALRDLLCELITDYLDEIEAQNWECICTGLGVSQKVVLNLIDFIKQNLSPSPLSPQTTRSVVLQPSFEVRVEKDMQLKIINLEIRNMPRLHISEYYRRLLTDSTIDAQSKKYVASHIKKAEEWLHNIHSRHERLDRVVRTLVKKQDQFFFHGPDHLVPFLQKSLSKELNISPSILSRLLQNKSIQTPFGIYPLKVFCPRNHFGNTRAQLQRLIQTYCTAHPNLGDSDVQKWLKTKGIQMARRTVNHYRNAS
jgi:RNA polymerase sigma-54 factor